MIKKILVCTLLLNTTFLYTNNLKPFFAYEKPGIFKLEINIFSDSVTNTIGACSIGLTTFNTCAYLSKKLHCRNDENIDLSGHRATNSLAAALATAGLGLSLTYGDSGWKLNVGALACATAAFAGLEWWEKKK